MSTEQTPITLPWGMVDGPRSPGRWAGVTADGRTLVVQRDRPDGEGSYRAVPVDRAAPTSASAGALAQARPRFDTDGSPTWFSHRVHPARPADAAGRHSPPYGPGVRPGSRRLPRGRDHVADDRLRPGWARRGSNPRPAD